MNDHSDQPDQSSDRSGDWRFGAGSEIPSRAAGEIEAVLRALSADGTARELRDEEQYLRLFEMGHRPERPDGMHLPVVPRKSLRTIRISGRVAAALAATLVVGVSAAAAYTGTLPDRLQVPAHRFLGAQAPPANPDSAPIPASSAMTTRPTPDRTALPTLSPPTGQPSAPVTSMAGVTPPDIDGAKGRCTAWSKDGLAATSAAYRILVDAAGGVSQIGSYCAAVLGRTPKPTHPQKAPRVSQDPAQPGPSTGRKAHDKDKPTPPGPPGKAAM